MQTQLNNTPARSEITTGTLAPETTTTHTHAHTRQQRSEHNHSENQSRAAGLERVALTAPGTWNATAPTLEAAAPATNCPSENYWKS